VNKYHPVFTYLLIFFALSILLKLFGIIDFESSEILGYAFIFYGFSIVYNAMGKHLKVTLFWGSSIFLTGVVLFIINNFEFANVSMLLYPSIIFIAGIDFLIIFLDDSSNRIFFFLSLFFILSGFLFTVSYGSIKFSSFLISLQNVAEEYWPIILIGIGIILIIWREEKDKKKIDI